MVLPLRSKNTNAAPKPPPAKEHHEEDGEYGGDFGGNSFDTGGVSFDSSSFDPASAGGGGGVSFDPATTENVMTGPSQLPVTPHPKKKQRRGSVSMTTTTTDPNEYGMEGLNHDDMQRLYGTTQEDHHGGNDGHKESDDSGDTRRHVNGGNGGGKTLEDDSTMMENGEIQNGCNEENSPPQEEEEEPDWEELAQHEPARTDIPIFLAARERRYEADKRFEAALDECHAALQRSKDALLEIAVEYYNAQNSKMEQLEADIKHNLLMNHNSRTMMQHRLNESAKEAQGLFAQLMMRVSQPFMQAAERLQGNNNADDYGVGGSIENVTEDGA